MSMWQSQLTISFIWKNKLLALLKEEGGSRRPSRLPALFPGRIDSHLLCLPPPQSSSSPAHLPVFMHEPCHRQANLASCKVVLESLGVCSANPPTRRV